VHLSGRLEEHLEKHRGKCCHRLDAVLIWKPVVMNSKTTSFLFYLNSTCVSAVCSWLPWKDMLIELVVNFAVVTLLIWWLEEHLACPVKINYEVQFMKMVFIVSVSQFLLNLRLCCDADACISCRHAVLNSCSSRSSGLQLHSTESYSLLVPLTCHTTIGDRAFPVAAARAWNSLPQRVRAASSIVSFRQELKTYLF